MKTSVATAQPEETLQSAAGRMIEANLGLLAVCDPRAGRRVVGVLTDRDICRHACASGKPLSELSVEEAMTRSVRQCNENDSTTDAQLLMAEAGVHRLPVVDSEGMLKGILSLSDIAAEAARESHLEKQKVTATEVAATLAAIGASQQAS
jgi:CBS domain-containing protein